MTDIAQLLGAEADDLLTHKSTGIPQDLLHLPGPDYIDRVFAQSDRPAAVFWAYLRNNAFKKDGVDYHSAADLCGTHRSDQQACWRHGPDLGTQGVSTADAGGRGLVERDPGCLSVGCGHHCLTSWHGCAS